MTISLQKDFGQRVQSTKFPEFDLEYLSSVLGSDVLEQLTDECKDDKSKVVKVIEYFTGRHCLFYSWFTSGTWFESISLLNELDIKIKVRQRCQVNLEYWFHRLQLCVLEITESCYDSQPNLSRELAPLYAYITSENDGNHYDVASEYIRNNINPL